jgi:hypothetical protein
MLAVYLVKMNIGGRGMTKPTNIGRAFHGNWTQSSNIKGRIIIVLLYIYIR